MDGGKFNYNVTLIIICRQWPENQVLQSSHKNLMHRREKIAASSLADSLDKNG